MPLSQNPNKLKLNKQIKNKIAKMQGLVLWPSGLSRHLEHQE